MIDIQTTAREQKSDSDEDTYHPQNVFMDDANPLLSQVAIFARHLEILNESGEGGNSQNKKKKDKGLRVGGREE